MISNIPYSNLVKKTLKQKRGPVIRTKMAPYNILLMAQLEEKLFKKQNLNHIYGGGILMIYFYLGTIVKKN